MKLFLCRTTLCKKQQYIVKKEDGTISYTCEGSFIKIPKKYFIRNESDVLIGSSENIPISGNPRFNIVYKHSEYELTEFFNTFKIEDLDWQINEYAMGHEIKISSGTKIIGTVIKKWFSWGSRFELEFDDEESAVILILITLSIQYARYSHNILLAIANI